MKRREFDPLLGGAAAAWPLAARAQQAARMRRVGGATNLAADDPEAQTRAAAFLQELQEFGWAVGRNMRINLRWGGGDAEKTRRYAAELVALAPDVILTSGATALGPLLQATWQCADRVCAGARSGRFRLDQQLGSAWRQCDWVHDIRIRPERQMVGTAQADRTGRDTSRGDP